MLKKLKKNKKKGFTLVELIVVLVILAILAALLIPALTKYIDKAKEKSIIAETRQIVMAAQTLVDEKWSDDQTSEVTVAENGNVKFSDVMDLAEIKDGTITGTVTVVDGKITSLTYQHAGKQCVYNPNAPKKYNVSKVNSGSSN
ncbi:prepilin-type N-terminal cleavage/methylation domain-containing protein [Dorea sp.]